LNSDHPIITVAGLARLNWGVLVCIYRTPGVAGFHMAKGVGKG